MSVWSAEYKYHTLVFFRGIAEGEDENSYLKHFSEKELFVRRARFQGEMTEPGFDFGWFVPNATGDEPLDVLEECQKEPDDDLITCVSSYSGKTFFYVSTKPISLLDMSNLETINYLSKVINNDILFKAFKIINDKVYRNSDFKNDIRLMQELLRTNIVDSEIQGWYHPTMRFFDVDTEDEHEKGIHRREVVIYNPEDKLEFIDKSQLPENIKSNINIYANLSQKELHAKKKKRILEKENNTEEDENYANQKSSTRKKLF